MQGTMEGSAVNEAIVWSEKNQLTKLYQGSGDDVPMGGAGEMPGGGYGSSGGSTGGGPKIEEVD